MKRPFRSFAALAIFCSLLTGVIAPVAAQTKAQESHPAYQVVISYLTYAMGQDWPKSAALIEKESLIGLRDRYIARIGSARTVQEELDMCRALDCSNLAEAKTLDPTVFYIRYHEGIQKRFPVTKEKLDIILKSKRVKLVMLGEETAEQTPDGSHLAHVLVRTKHNNGTRVVYSLELINLRKVAGKWLVTLDAMKPYVEPSEDDEGATVPKK